MSYWVTDRMAFVTSVMHLWSWISRMLILFLTVVRNPSRLAESHHEK